MTPPAANSGFPFVRVILLSLLAALLATVFWFGADILALRAKVAAVETERDVATTATELALSQLKERTLLAEGMINDLHRQLREPPDLSRLKVIVLTPPKSGDERGLFLWDSQLQAGSFTAWNLPPPPAGEAYLLQLTGPASEGSILTTSAQITPDGKFTTRFKSDVHFAGDIRVSVEVINTSSSANVRTLISGT